jgi:hypothetical protein
VCRVVDVPLEEVSGICAHRTKNGRTRLIAVGDRVAKIAWFSPPRSNEAKSTGIWALLDAWPLGDL